jgi:hypothetical protein
MYFIWVSKEKYVRIHAMADGVATRPDRYFLAMRQC